MPYGEQQPDPRLAPLVSRWCFSADPPDAPPAATYRVLPNGERCEVTLTLIRLAGISDEKFEQDAAWVRRDLQALKDLLET